MLKYLTGKVKRTAGIRVFEIRKRGSLILEFSLSPSNSYLSMLHDRWPPADTECRHLLSLKSTTERQLAHAILGPVFIVWERGFQYGLGLGTARGEVVP